MPQAQDAHAAALDVLLIEQITATIASGLIAWADEDRSGRASRYPIPAWSDSERIAERVAAVVRSRLVVLEQERDAAKTTLLQVRDNARDWHGDDAAKGRALIVIERWCEEALARFSAAKTLQSAAVSVADIPQEDTTT